MDKVHYKKPSFSKQCCMEEEHILSEQEIFVLKIIFEFFLKFNFCQSDPYGLLTAQLLELSIFAPVLC